MDRASTPRANAGATFNYRNKWMNVFGNYNYSYTKRFVPLILTRYFFNNGTPTGSDDKDINILMKMLSNNLRYGADFFPSSKTIIGFVVTNNFIRYDHANANHSTVNDEFNQPSYFFNTDIGENQHGSNTIANINFKHSFGSAGGEITADIDYGSIGNNIVTDSKTGYYNLDGNTRQEPDVLNGNQINQLIFKTAKVDYVNPLTKDSKLEAGFKTSYVNTDNDARFYNVKPTGTNVDAGKTNHFNYSEYYNALYLNYKGTYKLFDIQLGLRAEQTRLLTYQENYNIHFDSGYLQVFPSAFINYKLKKDQALGIAVSRRIDRPAYFDLNPFIYQIDATVYQMGNPNLLPQFTWSYELNYTLKNLNFSLGYSHTARVRTIVIARINDVLPSFPTNGQNITVQIPVNLSSQDYYGLSVAAPVHVNNWWNIINNANLYYGHFSGNLGNNTLNNGIPTLGLKMNNTFNFTNGWTSELSFHYISNRQDGYAVSKSQWGLDAGVQKTVLKNKGTIRFNMTDIFKTNLPREIITYQGQFIEPWHEDPDRRVANLSFTYRFGNNKVLEARRRTTGSEEERQRAGQ
jgi:iron complex outermembrane receptor protein